LAAYDLYFKIRDDLTTEDTLEVLDISFDEVLLNVPRIRGTILQYLTDKFVRFLNNSMADEVDDTEYYIKQLNIPLKVCTIDEVFINCRNLAWDL